MQVKQPGLTEAQHDMVCAAVKCAGNCFLRKYKVHRKQDKSLKVQTEDMIEKHLKRWGWSMHMQLGCICMLPMDA